MNKNLEKECFTQNYIIGADGELFRMAEFDLASISLLSSSSSRSFGGCINGGLCVLEFLDKVSVLLDFPLKDAFLDGANSNLSSLMKDRKKYMLTFLLIW